MWHVVSLKLDSINNLLFFNKELYNKTTTRHIKSFLLIQKANKSNIFRDEIRYKANQFFIQQKNAAKKVADRIMKSVK